MEFFEFFFSGPSWGWKVFVLIWFTNAFFAGIAGVVKAVYKGKSTKILAEMKAITNKDTKEEAGATIDDFR